MPKKPKKEQKPKLSEVLAGAFKNSLGSQAKPAQVPGELPMSRQQKLEKSAYELGTGVGDVFRVVPAMGREFMSNFGKWWETGTFGDPVEEDTDKPKKDKPEKDSNKEKLKDFVTSNIKTVDVLENILSEITLLRKLTEGSVKFNAKGRGAKYTDTATGKFIKTAAARETFKIPSPKTPTTVTPKEPGAPAPIIATPTVVTNKPPTISPKQEQQQQNQPTVEEAPSGGGITDMVPDFIKDKVMDKIKGKIPQSVLSKIPGMGGGAAGGGAAAGVPSAGAAATGSTTALGTATNFLAGTGGAVLAGAGGVIGGGMFAYDKFKEAGQTKEEEVQAAKIDLAKGVITKDQYQQQVAAANEKSTITKGEGIGGGIGRAAGAFGGAKAGAAAGAAIGSVFGGIGAIPGAAIGSVVGGIGGYFGGGKIGEAVGNIGGRITNFFGGSKNENNTATSIKSGNFSVTDNGVTTTGEFRDGKYFINGQEVTEKEYKEIREKLGLTKNDKLLSGQVSPSGALEERKKQAESARQNALADGASPEEADQISAKMLKHGSVISAGQGRGDVYMPPKLSPTESSKSGSVIQSYSSANRDMEMDTKSNSPTIINNTQAPSQSQPSIMPIKPQVRPEASTLTRYMDRILVY